MPFRLSYHIQNGWHLISLCSVCLSFHPLCPLERIRISFDIIDRFSDLTPQGVCYVNMMVRLHVSIGLPLSEDFTDFAGNWTNELGNGEWCGRWVGFMKAKQYRSANHKCRLYRLFLWLAAWDGNREKLLVNVNIWQHVCVNVRPIRFFSEKLRV